jgi:hypothetical protein
VLSNAAEPAVDRRATPDCSTIEFEDVGGDCAAADEMEEAEAALGLVGGVGVAFVTDAIVVGAAVAGATAVVVAVVLGGGEVALFGVSGFVPAAFESAAPAAPATSPSRAMTPEGGGGGFDGEFGAPLPSRCEPAHA